MQQQGFQGKGAHVWPFGGLPWEGTVRDQGGRQDVKAGVQAGGAGGSGQRPVPASALPAFPPQCGAWARRRVGPLSTFIDST